MNLSFKGVVFVVLLVLTFGSFLSLPQKARAYSPIIASCNSNVNHVNGWIETSSQPVMQLIDVRLDHYKIDGISVRLYSPFGDGQARVGLRSRDMATLLTSGDVLRIGATPAWYYIDVSDVEIPRATYYVQVTGLTQQVYWNYTSESDCIEDSYAVVNGNNQGFGLDMGFAVYAYDSSQSEPDTTIPSGSSDQLVGSTDSSTSSDDSSSGTSNSSSASNNSSQYPSKEDILNMYKNDGGLGLWGGLGAFFGNPLFGILFSLIGFLIFLGVIVLIIWLLVRRRPKKDDSKENIKSPEKPESKK